MASVAPVGGPNKERFKDRERRMAKAMGDEDLYKEDFEKEASIKDLRDKKEKLEQEAKKAKGDRKESLGEQIKEIADKIADLISS